MLTDILVLIISSADHAWGEDMLLEYDYSEKTFKKDIALSNGITVWHKMNDQDFSFVLVEQTGWAGYRDKLKKHIERSGRKVIVWNHESNPLNTCDTIKDYLGENCKWCHPFCHEGYPFIKQLMKCVAKIKEGNGCNNYADKLKLLIDESLAEEKEKITLNILRLFLPLDLDIQALKILAEKNPNKAIEYLKEMQVLLNNRKYISCIANAKKEASNIIDNKIKSKITDLIGKKDDDDHSFLYNFLLKLNKNEEFEEFIKTEKTNSFHDWYNSLYQELMAWKPDKTLLL